MSFSFLCSIPVFSIYLKINTAWLHQQIVKFKQSLDGLACVHSENIQFYRKVRYIIFHKKYKTTISLYPLPSISYWPY